MLDRRGTIECKVFEGVYRVEMPLLIEQGYEPVTAQSIFWHRDHTDNPSFWRDQAIDTCSAVLSLRDRYKFSRRSEQLLAINVDSPLYFQKNLLGNGLLITKETFEEILSGSPGMVVPSFGLSEYSKRVNRELMLRKILGHNTTADKVIACKDKDYAKVCVHPGTQVPTVFPIRVMDVASNSALVGYFPVDGKSLLVGVKRVRKDIKPNIRVWY